MSKIIEHKECIAIERIILAHRFDGTGSVSIAKEIKAKLGVEISRPTIDKHFKKHMNGELVLSLIEKKVKETLSTIAGLDEENGLKIPSFDHVAAKEIKEFLAEKSPSFGENSFSDSKSYAALCFIYADSIGLVGGNMAAVKEGKEVLKFEYVKYLEKVRNILFKAKADD